MSNVANIVTVARREYQSRVRARSFLVGTALLVLSVVAIAMVPIIVQAISGSGAQRVAVWDGAGDIGGSPAATLDSLLNAPTGGGTSAGGQATTGDFSVRAVTDLDAERRAVDKGEDTAVLALARGPSGDLAFTLYTNESSTGRVAQLIRQAVSAVVIADRLARLNVAPADQARIFAPADFSVAWADPARTEATQSSADQGASYFLGFGMTILIFMMIILYGQWVAASVVEEKSSRVMEVILNAATPFQLLTGKVAGVGGVALTQYLAILAAGLVALAAQGPVAGLLLGAGTAASSLPQGLTPGLLGLLVVYGVLGFLLYAVLFAGAGSLVSRQEDVNQVVTPMTLVATAGYMVGVYSATGLLDIRAGWLTFLGQVPFLSPFLMLSRVTSGQAAPWEVPLSIVLMAVTLVACLWLAARLYAVGVLLYGQRPGARTIWRLLRHGM